LNLFDSACGTIGDGNFNKTVEIFCEHDRVFVGFDETVDFYCERDGVSSSSGGLLPITFPFNTP